LDIVTRPDGKAGVRSKRSTTPRPQAGVISARPAAEQNGEPASLGPSAAVAKLQEALAKAELERLRAAELLELAEERLGDADAARRHLLDNVASGGDEARRRFASVLHDDVLQMLTGAELQLERIRTDAARTRYAAQLDQLKATMRQIEDSLRNLLYNVSPASQDIHLNLPDAIRDRLMALKAHTGIEPDVDLRLPKRAGEAVRSIVYRNISEAISNVEKHANATRLSLKAFASGGGIEVEVTDDGTGFIVSESLYLPGHLGLVAMRERAQLAGGWCRIESEPGAGTSAMNDARINRERGDRFPWRSVPLRVMPSIHE
jgi:signal transduction histidine kinase